MADQRPSFFRLPWLPRGQTPASAPTPARPAGEPQAPTRPPLRPAGLPPVQPPPPRTEPPTPAPARAVSQPPATSLPGSPSRAATPSGAATQRPTPPKTEPSSPPPTAVEPLTAPRKPTSPALPKAPSRPSTPSLSAPVSPQAQPLTKAPSPPKREPEPISEISQSPTLLDQSLSSHKEPEKLETQPDQAIVSENALAPAKQPQERKLEESKEVIVEPTREEVKGMANGEPKSEEVTQLPEPVPSTKASTGIPREEIFQEKEVVATSEDGRKPAETFIPPHPKVGRAHNHKSATFNGEKAPLHKEIKEDISKLVHKLGSGQGKQTLDGEKPFTIITLAGENRGASMTLSDESGKRERSIHIQRRYKTNPDESAETTTSSEESSSRSKKHRGSKAEEETATKACINSNVQGVNNSLVFNASVSTGNPGVQYALSRNPREPINEKHEAEEHAMLRDEFSITPSEKQVYAPTVRRRCLRGLFLESSDSDTDNPKKPRRHGCPYACKGSNIDIL